MAEDKVLTGDEIPKITFGDGKPEKISFGGENEEKVEEGEGEVPATGKPETPPSPLPSINANELVDIELPNGMKIKTKINDSNKRREKREENGVKISCEPRMKFAIISLS